MEAIRRGETELRLVILSEYLDEHPQIQDASVQTSFRDIDFCSGVEFPKVGKIGGQRSALAEIREVSSQYCRLMNSGTSLSEDAKTALARARSLILEGEASCFLDRGGQIFKLYDRTAPARLLLLEAKAALVAT